MPDPGFFDETHWRFAIQFLDVVDGVTILDMSDHTAMEAAMFDKHGNRVFTWRSTGAGAHEGTIDLSFANLGLVLMDATLEQHELVEDGQPYTWTLYDVEDAADPGYLANGRAYIGRPGETSTTFQLAASFYGSTANAVIVGVSPELAQLLADVLAAAAAAEAARAAAVIAQGTAETAASDAAADAAQTDADRIATAVNVVESDANADRAELAAAAAAALGGPIYPDVATALATATNGEFFVVQGPDPDGGLLIYRDDGGSPETATQIGTIAGTGEVAALEARLPNEETAWEGYLGDTPDSKIIFAETDEAGLVVRAITAGYADEAIEYLASDNGMVRVVHTKDPESRETTGTSIKIERARIKDGPRDFDTLDTTLTVPVPVTVVVTDEANLLAFGAPHDLAGQRIGTITVVRDSDSVTLTEGVNYSVDREQGQITGLINVTTFAVTVTYQTFQQRIDYAVADSETHVVTRIAGTDVNYAASMWEPAIPTGQIIVARMHCFSTDGATQTVAIQTPYLWRPNKTLQAQDKAYRDEREWNRPLLAQAMAALYNGLYSSSNPKGFRGIAVNGDSTTALAGVRTIGFNTEPNTTSDGGYRDAVSYFTRFDTATKALIETFDFDDGLGAGIHMKEGIVWGLALFLERTYGITADLDTVRNWSIGGTNSGSDTITGGYFNASNPTKLENIMDDSGNWTVCILPMGLNDTNDTRLLTLAAETITQIEAIQDAGRVPLVVTPCRKGIYAPASTYELWKKVCRVKVRAAKEAGAAYVDTSDMFDDNGLGAIPCSIYEISGMDTSLHQAPNEMNAQAQRIINHFS